MKAEAKMIQVDPYTDPVIKEYNSFLTPKEQSDYRKYALRRYFFDIKMWSNKMLKDDADYFADLILERRCGNDQAGAQEAMVDRGVVLEEIRRRKNIGIWSGELPLGL